ncbi:MAG: flagellar filament capping protein FliD [Bdellovibrionota bacterium]
MGLRFDPVGGGQFKQAVKQIMEAESQPLKSLEARKANEEARLKLFQEFKGKIGSVDKTLAELSSFRKFRELKVDLGDGEKLVSLTIDKEKAEPGTIELQIDQLAARTSVISNGIESADQPDLGLGYITMYPLNGESYDIYIDASQSSLNSIATLINREEQSPVRAAVVRDMVDPEAPYKLILTAKKEGAENQIEFPDLYFLDGSSDFYFDDNKDATNAIVSVNGFPIEMDSNDISDFLPGVNLHLKQARPDQPFTITIKEDYQKIGGKVKGMVDQMNQVFDFITKQNQIDERSDTKTTFAGDTGLQGIEYRLRNLMHEGFLGGQGIDGDDVRLVFLNEIGVEFSKTGQLQFKEEKFNKALERDFSGIAEAITGSFGLAFQLRQVLDGYSNRGTGLLALREHGMRDRIKDIDRQIDNKTRQLDRRQQSLVEQFARMEAAVSNLQRQQAYLSPN